MKEFKLFMIYMNVFEPVKNNEEYMINRNGEVKGKRGNIMKPYLRKDGYYDIKINGKT